MISTFRWIQIKAYDVMEFLQKMLIPTELESLDKMRFEIVLLPNAVNGHTTDPLRFRHRANAPVGGVLGSAVKLGLDHCLHFGLRNLGNTLRPWCILFQSRQPKCQETLPPQLNGRSRNFQLSGDLMRSMLLPLPFE